MVVSNIFMIVDTVETLVSIRRFCMWSKPNISLDQSLN